MELILAEKPSAARNFAKALGGKTGNYAGTEYKITNLRGHVMGLLPPDKQVPTEKVEFYKSWDLENLPWNLNDFAWKKGVLSGCKDIISGLKDELKEADCVVIATDVDPSGEGELLAWEALEKCGWRGPTKRMYFADEAPASVQKAFRERKTLPSMDKDGDYVKAVVRERWDLASMQFTRAATLVARKKGFRTVVRQGRLKSVMVKLTGDQLKAYNEYVRKPFYEARFKDENGNIFARKTDDPEDIRFDSPDQVDLSQLHDSAVVEDSRAKKHTAPGKLLDLAGLSAILAKQGFKPANVLKTYQEMYENQIVSYPRTEDKEVTPEQFGELLPLVDKIAGVVGVDTSLLSHRTARKTHVKEGGAHGANRPGINVPESLAELEKGYGRIGCSTAMHFADIGKTFNLKTLARNSSTSISDVEFFRNQGTQKRTSRASAESKTQSARATGKDNIIQFAPRQNGKDIPSSKGTSLASKSQKYVAMANALNAASKSYV